MAKETATSSSLLPTLLLILFIALKLTHQISWSWLWVLSPFWIPIGAALAVALVALVIYAVSKIVSR